MGAFWTTSPGPAWSPSRILDISSFLVCRWRQRAASLCLSPTMSPQPHLLAAVPSPLEPPAAKEPSGYLWPHGSISSGSGQLAGRGR